MVTFDDTVLDAEASADELLSVHQLLTELEVEHPRRARIVECRVFGGMMVEEVAEALSVSPATVKREWRLATVNLFRTLKSAPEE